MPNPITSSLRTPPDRVLIIKPSALGDIINTLPVLSGLRQLFPAARISWVVQSSFAELLDGHPHLERLIRFDRGRGAKLWQWPGRLWQLLRELRHDSYDLALDLQGLLRSGLMTLAVRARWKVGLREAREGAGWFCHQLLPEPPGPVHAVDRYWRVIEALGGTGLRKQFILPRPAASESWAAAKLAGLPRPWIAVNLGTRWETKRWPVESFAWVVQQLHERHGGSVLLVGAKGEEHLAHAFLARTGPGPLDLVGQTRLSELTALLARADLLLSNDSGPMHLAAALGRPVVVPFTCTDPRRHGPYGQLGNTVCTSVACAASYLKHCPYGMRCMDELTPARLLPLAEANLRGWSERCA